MKTSLQSYVRHNILNTAREDNIPSLLSIPPTAKCKDFKLVKDSIYNCLGGSLSERLLNIMAADIPQAGAPLSYHHYFHALDVVSNVFEYSGFFELEDNRYKIVENSYDAILLLVAAMFHDYGHTQSGLPDLVNIAKAINLFTPVILGETEVLFIDTLGLKENGNQRLLSNYILSLEDTDDDNDVNDIATDFINLIAGTQYPYVKTHDVGDLVAILRMCDTGTSLQPGWLDSIYGGLFYEMARAGKVGNTDHGFEKFCKNQVEFIAAYGLMYRISEEHTKACSYAHDNAIIVYDLVKEWISLQ